MGSGGRSLASAARASSRIGTTVWSRYCLVGRPLVLALGVPVAGVEDGGGGSSRGRLAAGVSVVGAAGVVGVADTAAGLDSEALSVKCNCNGY